MLCTPASTIWGKCARIAGMLNVVLRLYPVQQQPTSTILQFRAHFSQKVLEIAEMLMFRLGPGLHSLRLGADQLARRGVEQQYTAHM